MESEIAKMVTEIIEMNPKNDQNKEERNKQMTKTERLMLLFLKIVKYLVVLGIVTMISSCLNYYGQAIGKSSKNKGNDRDRYQPQYWNLNSRPNDPYIYPYDVYFPQPYVPRPPPATENSPFDTINRDSFGDENSTKATRFDGTIPDNFSGYKLYNMPANIRHAMKFLRNG